MEKSHILRLIFFSGVLLRFITAADDDNPCRPASCGRNEPQVRFPFRIIGRQPPWCGFPGYGLSCNKQNRTIIRLSPSHSYTVNAINYVSQVISIDPDFCQRNGINIISFNLTDTPFDISNKLLYTFFNCSLQNFSFMYPAIPFTCLNSKNHSVAAVRTGLILSGMMPSSCEVMKTIAVPTRWNEDIRSDLQLKWFIPDCITCEIEFRACGWKSLDQIGCLGSRRGFPKSAMYGLSLGIGMPVMICIIGLICYSATRVRNYSETRHQSVDLFSISITPQPATRTGLDGTTIESYSKTTLGESCRLPNDDSMCIICLSDYKPKESLRTIPECNHYFHAECIDEWLKLNATCPVCRNSPESSSLVTPCSTTSTTSTVE
ncbi:putative RING-H2 finger protein ATL21A [Bidens hawaiensis]|uniref:putative RING-H2 finger protein ATL21A n=1 Tax=Bidens hawaiensis TaxID=980011 RepID=UPI00404A61EA